jgi:hypothetical protein
MTKYLVNSNRLDGLKRGDIIDGKDLGDANIGHLVKSGHLSPQDDKKHGKTKEITEE